MRQSAQCNVGLSTRENGLGTISERGQAWLGSEGGFSFS